MLSLFFLLDFIPMQVSFSVESTKTNINDLAISQKVNAGETPEGIDNCEWATIQDQIRMGKYKVFSDEQGGYHSINVRNDFGIDYLPDGTTQIKPHQQGGMDYHIGMRLTSIGYENLETFCQPIALHAEQIGLAQGSKVTYQWSDELSEWWINDQNRLEQWFYLREAPEGKIQGQALRLRLAIDTDMAMSLKNNQLAFHKESRHITYDKLKVWDAKGQALDVHFDQKDNYLDLVISDDNATYPLTIDPVLSQEAYIKASNPNVDDFFGGRIAISGETMVIGSTTEDSNATGVNGFQGDNSAANAGAAYVFVRNGATWSQQAYLKASDTEANDNFGIDVDIDGETIVVGSKRGGVGDEGAAYVYTRSGTTWTLQATLQASNKALDDLFGESVNISGETIVVGAPNEDSNATGINGDQTNNSGTNSGAVYVFTRSGTSWSQQAYIKASNTNNDDAFGISVGIDGETLVVGALGEDSNATGINGSQTNNSMPAAGAVYVFVRSGTSWSQQAYIKASNTNFLDFFGGEVAISGETIVTTAVNEDSNATGINGDQTNNSASDAGAAYVFVRSGTTWTQEAYLKASNTGVNDQFGFLSVDISDNTIVIGASNEDSNATGFNGDQTNNSNDNSGAAYVFMRGGTTWQQQAYIKASNNNLDDIFGIGIAIDGETVVIGAKNESSNATGVNGNQANNSTFRAGAAYVFSVPYVAPTPPCPMADYLISTLNGATTSVCTGTFVDSGDMSGNYGNNENYSTTFCSDNNQQISFTFENFNLEATNDQLEIFDGPNTAAVAMNGSPFSGAGVANSPGTITSSGTCLTFRFTSNGATDSNGWLASINCTGGVNSGGASSWTGYPYATACADNMQLGGKVYDDINLNGQLGSVENGVKDVTVKLFDNANVLVNTQITDTNGDYAFSGLTASTVYRVEFVVPTAYQEGFMGPVSNSAVQFAESGQCDVNFGIFDPSAACGLSPYLMVPCYNNGDPSHPTNSSSTGVARFDYYDSGNSPAPSYFNYADFGTIGPVWGTAYNRSVEALYMSTLLKRHVGLGPGGIGAIYQRPDAGNNTSATVLYDFGNLAGTVAANAIRFPGAGTGFGEEGSCGTCDNVDATTFNQVGKAGFGDLELSADDQTLYVSNLADRKIYRINTQNPTPGSASPLPGMPWLTNAPCTNGVARPWGLKYYKDKLYVGVVCDASTSSCSFTNACADLTAIIYSYDGNSWVEELNFPLDYYREAYVTGSNYWVKWVDNYPQMAPYVDDVVDAQFAQPILSNIEFDDDGSMILALGDRTSMQLGYRAPEPGATSSDISEQNMAHGDILRTSYDGSTYTLENNGVAGSITSANSISNTGPGGKSFYWGDFWYGGYHNSGVGGLALLPGVGQVVFSMADAVDPYTNGLTWMSNVTGKSVRRLEVYQGAFDGTSPFFAKSNGLGDIELVCTPAPIEIGNYIFWDDEGDGLMNPSNQGVSGVSVELYLDPDGNTQGNNAPNGDEILVATTTSDTYGRYVFSYSGHPNGLSSQTWQSGHTAVLPETTYQIRIPNWAADAGLTSLAASLGFASHIITLSQNQGTTGTHIDSDGYDLSGNAGASVTTTFAGENNHTIDFGFSGGCAAPIVIPTANAPCVGDDLNLMSNASGGIPPYTYNWTGPNGFNALAENPILTNADTLDRGTYYLTVTDAIGCPRSVSIEVAVNAAQIGSFATVDPTCGASNGSIDVTVDACATPFIYDWDNDGTGDTDDAEDLTGLAAGTYTLYLTDVTGCYSANTIFLNNAPSPNLSFTKINETCGNSNGSINLTVSGGTAPYTFDWDNDGIGDNNDAEDLSGLSAGIYNVTVTDNSGCKASTQVILDNTDGPIFTLTNTDEVCGNANASIDLTVSQGIQPYTYDWDNDGTGDIDDPQDLTGLSAGTYNVTITDANGCTQNTSVIINNTSSPTLGTTTTNETCGNANGTVDLTVSGGTAPFTYDWDYDGIGDNNDNEDIIGASAGDYNVTVTDANGCTITTTATITNTPGLTLSAIPTPTTDCRIEDGGIDMTITNGTAPYQIDWNNDGYGDNDDTEDLSGLATGAYQVIVTDANGCTAVLSVDVLEANPITISTVITNPTTCDGTGDIDLTITGGTAPYVIDWNNDGIGDGDDAEDLTNLPTGNYQVVICDANGCVLIGNASIRDVREPSLNAVVSDATCGGSNGTINLSISDVDGGAPYTFDWDNDGIGDNDDTEDLSGLSPGTYIVTVTNNINCTSTLAVHVGTTNGPILSIVQENADCLNQGSINLTISAGTAPYNIDWDNDGIGDNDDTEDLSGLSAGTYRVSVTDNAGCIAATLVEITETPIPVLGYKAVPEDCDGNLGAIDLFVLEGVGPFTFDWDNDGTGDNDDTEDLNGLSAGTYNVTVTDGLGCTATTSSPIIVQAELCCPLIADPSPTQTICEGEAIPSLEVKTTALNPDSIAFVYFSSPQTDSSLIYSNGTGIDTVQIALANDTVRLTNITVPAFVSNGAAADTFYVYGILQPTPAAVTCRPYQEILVIVNPLPALVTRDTHICTAQTVDLSTLITDNLNLTGSVAYYTSLATAQSESGAIGSNVNPTTDTLFYVRKNTSLGCKSIAVIPVNVDSCDWGDLPDITASTAMDDYQTTNANNGPVHIIIPGLMLGSSIDGELDGQPTSDALGDNVDEDGLAIFASLNLYPNMTFRLPFSYVNTTGDTAHVEAWIDWNGDGDFDEPDEMVVNWDDATDVFPNRIEVTIPATAKTGSLLGYRIRISHQDNMTPYGKINSGEVEDYLIGIGCPQVCLPIQATVLRN